MSDDRLTPFAAAVRRLYDTDDGKLVIDTLKEQTCERTAMPSTVGPGVGELLAFHEGKRDLVLTLYKIIKMELKDD